jgi:DHA1 family multidrug resistance protein-like MFS transporter
MDNIDKDIEKAERDASPNRFQEFTPAGEPIERIESGSSSSSSAATSQRVRDEIGMSRAVTQREHPGILERNSTAMSRILTQKKSA